MSKFVRRKKPTQSTNIPLLSYRKSEQQKKIISDKIKIWSEYFKILYNNRQSLF